MDTRTRRREAHARTHTCADARTRRERWEMGGGGGGEREKVCARAVDKVSQPQSYILWEGHVRAIDGGKPIPDGMEERALADFSFAPEPAG